MTGRFNPTQHTDIVFSWNLSVMQVFVCVCVQLLDLPFIAPREQIKLFELN